MRKVERFCKNCRWYAYEDIDEGYVCANAESDYCADWVEPEDWCIEWEKRRPAKLYKEHLR